MFDEFLSYCPTTGNLLWIKTSCSSRPAGTMAAKRCEKSRYAKVQLKGKCFLAHRVAWELFYHEKPPAMIDHINGDPFDNRIENLRASNLFLNNRNKKAHRDGKLFGAHFVRGKYHGSFSYRKKSYHVGVFNTEKEAHDAVMISLKKKNLLSEKCFTQKGELV